MINFYDFEVFKHEWLVVIINPFEKRVERIHNDVNRLERYYNAHKHDIWVGFNSRHYDQYILKGLLCGFKAWDINDWIINKGLPGYQFSSLLKKVPLINYDVMLLNSSLKQLEGFQGHNIHETGVDFTIDRPLTAEEIEETFSYCQNDVEETINIWLACKSDFDAQMSLVKMFNLPLNAMSKTKAQISAQILECEYVQRNDEWELFKLDCIELEKSRTLTVKRKKKKDEDESTTKGKVVEVVQMKPHEWFLNEKYQNYRLYLETEVAGVKHQLGWGGIHGAKEKYHYKCDKDHLIIHVDVESYYPRLMIWHNLLTRNAKRPERFRDMFNMRMELKHAGKKAAQAPLKIVINGTFGICKDKNNAAYDPRNANLICINGQLMLLDLVEKLEKIPTFELIQSNTDGLIIKIHRAYFDMVDDVCYEWEKRTDMVLAFDYIKEIWQKDVNNYVFRQFDGKVERQGAYVKELKAIDNDLPIVNKALVNYMLKGVPVEDTINNCDSLIDFQKICKLSSKFDYVEHNDRVYTNKCYRIFADKRSTADKVCKVKLKGKNGKMQYNKFENTSVHSFIDNGHIVGVKVPEYLDKQFYIDMANKRLEQYGI